MPTRKTVTVLFCDVTGSTALGDSLDPEALQGVLGRYFERMKSIVERHGGAVEKFIGDAVMAVFGIPAAHEDDALRALRAAEEMRASLPELGVNARIGVNTGEVMAGLPERLVTGDAVNVAARLEQAAEPGEILFGTATHDLVAGAVEADTVDDLVLKGKPEPVRAYRLRRVVGAPERRHESRFVGRGQELGRLEAALARVDAERRCELVTIVADAGAGKSRLVAEFLAGKNLRTARGHCLPYGEGITYWPVIEVLKQLGVVPEDPSAQPVIAALLGESAAPVSTDQIAWAVRKTLERAAAEAPLAVIFDDIQWGEERFLDLVEHISLLSSGAPILIVCMARPELLDRRPAWTGVIRLEPLASADVAQLIPDEIGGALRERIVRAAGGNPLFVTEMVAMSAEDGGEVVVPPTLKALLAARLDQLDPQERGVLERGAVEGEIFHRGSVLALGAEEPVLPRLSSLVRKELIQPDPAQLPGEDGFRFRHLLIRDSAYEALSKRERADLHGAFATWLSERGQGLAELDEILGYHYEQAYLYRHELGLPDDGVRADALRHLRAAEERAMARQDYPAARKLIERALALVRPGELEFALEFDRLDAAAMVGDLDTGLSHARAARERAAALGDRAAELTLEMNEVTWRSFAGRLSLADVEAALQRILPELEETGSDLGLYNAYWIAAWIQVNKGLSDAALPLARRSAEHAERLPVHCVGFARRIVGIALDTGSAPASEMVDFIDAWEKDWGIRVPSLRRAVALAQQGRIEEGVALAISIREELRERGNANDLAQTSASMARLLELSGDIAAAEAVLAEGVIALGELGIHGVRADVAGERAILLVRLGRLEEAAEMIELAESTSDAGDVAAQLNYRIARTLLLLRRGEPEQALELARQAAEMAGATTWLVAQAEVSEALGEVLSALGRTDEGRAAFENSIALYDRKENVVLANRLRQRLAAMRSGDRGGL